MENNTGKVYYYAKIDNAENVEQEKLHCYIIKLMRNASTTNLFYLLQCK